MDDIFRFVFAALDFLEDDPFLTFNFFAIEEGVGEHVGEDIHGDGQVFGERDQHRLAARFIGQQRQTLARDRKSVV